MHMQHKWKEARETHAQGKTNKHPSKIELCTVKPRSLRIQSTAITKNNICCHISAADTHWSSIMSSQEQAMMYPAEDAIMAWTEDTSLRKSERKNMHERQQGD